MNEWDAALAEEDRICRIMFGVGSADAGEDELGDVVVHICKGRGDDKLLADLTRDALFTLGDVVASCREIASAEEFERLEPLLIAAMKDGSGRALSSLADALEPHWHNQRLSSDAVVRLVERTEALRRVVRRMEAAQMTSWAGRETEHLPLAR